MSSTSKNYFPWPRERFFLGIRLESFLACLPDLFLGVFLLDLLVFLVVCWAIVIHQLQDGWLSFTRGAYWHESNMAIYFLLSVCSTRNTTINLRKYGDKNSCFLANRTNSIGDLRPEFQSLSELSFSKFFHLVSYYI